MNSPMDIVRCSRSSLSVDFGSFQVRGICALVMQSILNVAMLRFSICPQTSALPL